MRPKLTITLWTALCLAALCPAQDTEGFRFSVRPEKLSLAPAAKGRLVLVAESEPRILPLPGHVFHPGGGPQGDHLLRTVVPALAHEVRPQHGDRKRQVYDGTVEIPLNFAVSASAPAEGKIIVRISFQGCSPVLCYLPQTQDLAVPFIVKGGLPPPRPAAEDAALRRAGFAAAPAPPSPGDGARRPGRPAPGSGSRPGGSPPAPAAAAARANSDP